MAAPQMSIRQRREWNRRLLEKLEAVEKATEELHQEMAKANDAGMSAYAISLPLASSTVTVQKIIDGVRNPG